MFSLENELKLFKKKSINNYECTVNDLYNPLIDISNKISRLDKNNKRAVMSTELLTDEINQKNELIKSLKKEISNKEDWEKKSCKKILNILDQIEVIQKFSYESKNAALIENMKSINMIIKKELREIGIEEIATIGEIFNSEFHECIEAIEDQSKNKYEIVDVVKRGYTLSGKTIRVAYVIAVK